MKLVIKFSKFLLPAIVCAAIPLIFIPAAQRQRVSSEGGEIFQLGHWLLAIAAGLSILVCIGGLVCLAFDRTWRIGMIGMICSVSYFIAFNFSLQMGEKIRMEAFTQLAERSKPLVSAIHKYEQHHGRPPESLASLVPEFLPAIPSTGMRAYPEYRYSTNSANFDGNPWVLFIHTPLGVINFDQFIYLPLTNYPKTGYGGCLEKVGDWAYVHE